MTRKNRGLREIERTRVYPERLDGVFLSTGRYPYRGSTVGSPLLSERCRRYLCRVERHGGDRMVSVVAHPRLETQVLERRAGAGAGQRSHGDGVRAEIGVGGVTGGVVYEIVGVVRVLAVTVEHGINDHTVAHSTVARHTERVVSDKVCGAVGIAGIGAV